jgi:hypothetical protein
VQSRPSDRSPRPWQPQRPIKQPVPAPLGQNSASLEGPGAILPKLRLARGLDAPSGKAPPRLRVGCPLGRDSSSLEGCAHPRVGPRFAQGSRGSATPAPTPPTGALNALTRRGHPGQRANPRHAAPLTPPGNHIPVLFRQPPW